MWRMRLLNVISASSSNDRSFTLSKIGLLIALKAESRLKSPLFRVFFASSPDVLKQFHQSNIFELQQSKTADEHLIQRRRGMPRRIITELYHTWVAVGAIWALRTGWPSTPMFYARTHTMGSIYALVSVLSSRLGSSAGPSMTLVGKYGSSLFNVLLYLLSITCRQYELSSPLSRLFIPQNINSLTCPNACPSPSSCTDSSGGSDDRVCVGWVKGSPTDITNRFQLSESGRRPAR